MKLNKEQQEKVRQYILERNNAEKIFIEKAKAMNDLIVGITGKTGFSRVELSIDGELKLTFPQTHTEKVNEVVRKKNIKAKK